MPEPRQKRLWVRATLLPDLGDHLEKASIQNWFQSPLASLPDVISYKPDVLGARIRHIFPMYPTVRPSTDTIIANAMSESMMTGKVRLSGEALHSINEGMRPERCDVIPNKLGEWHDGPENKGTRMYAYLQTCGDIVFHLFDWLNDRTTKSC